MNRNMPSMNFTSDRREYMATAALVRLSCFERRPEGTVGMSDGTPVLTCRMESSVADHIRTDCSPSNVIVGYVGEISAMLIQFQFGDVQVCWLAELAVPAIWAAVEKWQQEGRIPMAFHTGDGEHVSTSSLDMSPAPLPMPLTWVEPDLNDPDAAGQFFISERCR